MPTLRKKKERTPKHKNWQNNNQVLKRINIWNQTLMTTNDDMQHRIQRSENIQRWHHHEYENKITLRENLKQPKNKLRTTTKQIEKWKQVEKWYTFANEELWGWNYYHKCPKTKGRSKNFMHCKTKEQYEYSERLEKVMTYKHLAKKTFLQCKWWLEIVN